MKNLNGTELDWSEVLEMAGTELEELVKATHSNGHWRLSVHVNDDEVVDNAAWSWSFDNCFGDSDWFNVFVTGRGSQDCTCGVCKKGAPETRDDWIVMQAEDPDWIIIQIEDGIKKLEREFVFRLAFEMNNES